MNSCWQELQIEATTNQKTIKLAYAERIKRVHPEDDPEGFKRLQAAYKTALTYAKQAGKTGTTPNWEQIEHTQQTAPTIDFSQFNEQTPQANSGEEGTSPHEEDWDRSSKQLLLKIKEACQQAPYYPQLITILSSKECIQYLKEEHHREALTDQLLEISFFGDEQEQQQAIQLCQDLKLFKVAAALAHSSQQQLEDQFSVDMEAYNQEAQTYLSECLSSLELVTDFYFLLKVFEADTFRYYLTSDDFRHNLTQHLLNYYFFGPWEHRMKLVALCQEYNLPELAHHIYWIGLKNPDIQAELTTEREA
ncbi:J domain-containing protein [Streptococcus suis]|nr:J domain-containing protein [Streptococcus suis]